MSKEETRQEIGKLIKHSIKFGNASLEFCGRSFKREIDVRSKGNISKGVRTKDIRPGRYSFGGNDDPKVFLRVVDEEEAFLLGGADVPGFA
jgi:hypothetical protein